MRLLDTLPAVLERGTESVKYYSGILYLSCSSQPPVNKLVSFFFLLPSCPTPRVHTMLHDLYSEQDSAATDAFLSFSWRESVLGERMTR